MGTHGRGILSLVVVATLWGTTFVVIKGAVGTMDPAVLVLTRFTLAALVFAPFVRRGAALWRAGLELGLWLGIGYGTQAVGLVHTTAGRSAFITALSVVLVPLMAAAGGRRIGWRAWFAALVALIGVWLLAGDGGPPNIGDAWTLVTAASYALYVLRLEAHARRHRATALAAAQLWGVLPFALGWVALARPAWPELGGLAAGSPWLAVVYLALVTTALTTVLQTAGQRRVSATEAALVYTTEPAWAALFAWWVLAERLGPRGAAGAAVILAALIIGQWPARSRRDAYGGREPGADRVPMIGEPDTLQRTAASRPWTAWGARHALALMVGLLWASPYTLIGLLLGAAGLVTGGHVRRCDRVIEFHGGAVRWLVRRLPHGRETLAITLGHVVLGQSKLTLDASRAHERVHVRQYERWGPFMGPAYLLSSLVLWIAGRQPYRDNPFEREAHDREGAIPPLAG